MALIKCPECGKEISDQVKRCPFCGYPIKKKISKKMISVFVAVAVICVGSGLVYNQTRAYNEYIDNAVRFAFFAESVVLKADKLLDDITSIWFDSIYEEDNYLTDEYTQDENGIFYDDFNTALGIFFDSRLYLQLQEGIENGKDIVAEYYAKLRNPPDTLKDVASKISALQSAYNAMITLALNPEGNYSNVSEGQISKKENFNIAYNEFKMTIPEKKHIIFKKNTKYDFRKSNFGMTKEEILNAEAENYNLEADFVSDQSIMYKNVSFENDLSGRIEYWLDDMRALKTIYIGFSKETTEKSIVEWLSSIYGADLIYDDCEKGLFISLHNEIVGMQAALGRQSETGEVIGVMFYPYLQEEWDELMENRDPMIGMNEESEKNTETTTILSETNDN